MSDDHNSVQQHSHPLQYVAALLPAQVMTPANAPRCQQRVPLLTLGQFKPVPTGQVVA
jgi:hypothetical protein